MPEQTNENPMLCECLTWARTEGFAFAHHTRCPQFNLDRAVRALVAPLVRGMEAWASDEDGIHPEAWDAYVAGKRAIGERVPYEDGMAPDDVRAVLDEDTR